MSEKDSNVSREAADARAIAEARRAEAEAAKFEAEAREAEARALQEQVEADRKVREDQRELARNKYHHIYRFTDSINEKSVALCMERIDVWHRLDPNCDITIIFTSPGGSVVDGMALWDYLHSMKDTGHRLITVAQGMAASMAGILIQAGDERIMGKESYLLIHQVQAGVMGSFGELEDRMKWLELVQERILDIFAKRSKMPRNQIKKKWTRTDWWLSSDEALDLGFVDKVQ